jgi:hypothetical protein
MTLKILVMSALETISEDGGFLPATKDPVNATSKRVKPNPYAGYAPLADDIIKAWDEDPDQIVTPDAYEDVCIGIHEYAKARPPKKKAS